MTRAANLSERVRYSKIIEGEREKERTRKTKNCTVVECGTE
jgi:hypothetical protein